MKLQRMTGNGQWVDETRVDELINLVLAREVWVAPRMNRQPMTTRQQILDYLSAGNKAHYDNDWYAQIRDADAFKPRAVRQPDYPNGRRLDCGCTVYYRFDVMNASHGTACQECYDRMSD